MAITFLQQLELRHFVQMCQLEAQYYDAQFITPAEESYAWYVRYPWSVAAAAVDDQVVGFVNLFPVRPPIFAALLEGTFNDRLLRWTDIVDMTKEDGPLDLFLCCVAVAENYRRQGLTRALLQAAVAPYRAVQERCRWIVTDNVTDAGAAFSERYGFSLVCRSDHQSTVYRQPFYQFLDHIDQRQTR